MDGVAFDGPKNAIGYNGGLAWAGWTRTGPQRATYKQEAFHSFTVDGGGSYPPFPNLISPTAPAPWTIVETLQANGYLL